MFYATRLVSFFRQLGSQHDGDRQYDVARLLSQVEADPYESLLYVLRSPDPYDRAFAIQVIMHLGDRRFGKVLTEMQSDKGDVKQWDLLPYETVGQAASYVIRQIEMQTALVGTDVPISKWLADARRVNM